MIPVLRERLDGASPSHATFLVVNLVLAGVERNVIERTKLPIMDLHEMADATNPTLLRRAVPSADAVLQVRQLVEGLHITNSDSLPVTTYPDGAEQATSNWQWKTSDALSTAMNVIQAGSGVKQYQWFTETVWTHHDVSNSCQLMQTADREKAFQARGATTVIFSPGDIDGAWGMANSGPVSAPYSGEWTSNGAKWWYNHCHGWGETTWHQPALYVRDDPLGNHGYMKMVTTHELAHHFTMQHANANCFWSGGMFYQTAEAFTSEGNKPSDCVWGFGTYLFEFSSMTNTRMWGERQRYTTCYNAGTC